MNNSTHFTMTSNNFFALKEYQRQRLSNGDKIVYQVLCSHLYGKSYCFQIISQTKDKNYVIDGTNVSALEVQKYLEKMGYRDIVDIANRVSLMMKRDSFSILSEYGYFFLNP